MLEPGGAEGCGNSQGQLLEGLDGKEWGAGVPLQDLHVLLGLHQGCVDQLVHQ